jgi:hypothetical protein
MFVRLDRKLRGLWAFWDTHGTRILGVAQGLHSSISAVTVVVADLSPRTAAVLLAVSAVLGGATRARGQTNAALPPAPPAPGG